jgi:hypothetical protein
MVVSGWVVVGWEPGQPKLDHTTTTVGNVYLNIKQSSESIFERFVHAGNVAFQ